MATKRFIVRTSEGGTGKGRTWTNVFHINTSDNLSDPSIKTDADAIVAALRPGTLAIYTIDAVIVKDPTADGHGYDPAKVRTIPYGVNGTKVMGLEKPEIKEVVVKLVGHCSTGRSGHTSLRMICFDSEVIGGSDGDPSAVGLPSGTDTIVAALNAMIAGGTEFRKYGKRKNGEVTDEAISEWSYSGVGYRTARNNRRKRGTSTSPSGWLQDAKNILDDVLRMTGSYQLAKQGSALLALPAVGAALGAIEAGAETAITVLPELALVL